VVIYVEKKGVAGWMWHNIWREKGRWESGLASNRWRVYPNSMTSLPVLLAPVSCVAVLSGSIGFSPRLLSYACLALTDKGKYQARHT
jgi:hypothetical protein